MKRKQKRLGKKKEGTTQKQFGTLTQKENAIHTNFQKKNLILSKINFLWEKILQKKFVYLFYLVVFQ